MDIFKYKKGKLTTTFALFRNEDDSGVLLVSKKDCEFICKSSVEAFDLYDGGAYIEMGLLTQWVLPRLSKYENLDIMQKN